MINYIFNEGFSKVALTILLSFSITYFLIPIIKNIGFKYDILDIPNARKQHKKPIVSLGGVAITFSCIITLFILSKINPHSRTSKTRICVTVGMMTTGYDCTDILNICMMRPVYSPSEFIQMKGRGTRKCDFSQVWISKSEIPDHIDAQKAQFLLFDFFGNYDFFEKDFDYHEVL